MNYFFLVELLILIYLLIVARHGFFRARFFLHAFQQKGYKAGAYFKWIKSSFSERVVAPPHLFVLPLFLIELASDHLTETASAIIICIFGIFSFSWISYMERDREKKPLVLTPRMTRLAVTLTLIYMAAALTGINMGYAYGILLPDIIIMSLIFILADIFIPFFVLMAASLMSPVEHFIQERFKSMARNKLARMKDLRVIAITGSYGKTSTKFILKTLLGERFNVCFTPGSFNTPMGICKVINNDLQASHQILILEMGARHPGNIRELCEIARPDVAVVTNVGKAHLETFGSVLNIGRTKAELVEGLRPGGTAILNTDDKIVASMNSRKDIEYIPAGLETGIFSVSDIRYGSDGCSFTITDPDGATATVTTPLLGKHNIGNLVQGFAVARYFGMRTDTIALTASQIEPVEHRLELKKQGDVILIDDAFNSNPVGARNAVEVLSQFSGGRRIIVTPGMVELGDDEYAENKGFGRHIGNSGIELVLLVGKERSAPIIDGLNETGYPENQIMVFERFFDARAWLDQHHQSGDIILYENDLPDLDEK